MKQVRSNTFETNSSSTHSICMCTKDQYDKWASDWDNLKADSILYCEEELVTVEEAVKEANRYREVIKLSDVLDVNSPDHDDAIDTLREDGYMTCDDWDDYIENETYYNEFTTSGGETVVAFGYYGWDG